MQEQVELNYFIWSCTPAEQGVFSAMLVCAMVGGALSLEQKKMRLYEGMYVGMYVEPLYPDLKAWCVGVWCVGVWCVGVGLCRRGAV